MTKKSPWQLRALTAGLSQTTLTLLTGHNKSVISRQMRSASGVPRHTRSIIIAWELMTPDQRAEWLGRVEGEAALDVAPDAAPSPPSEAPGE